MENKMFQFLRILGRTGWFFCWMVLAGLEFVSCRDITNASFTEPYTNKLSLGIGANITDFTLKGENDHFLYTPSLTIYWRVETYNEFAGTTINLDIEKFDSNSNTFKYFVTYKTYSSLNGHIAISNFTQGYFHKGQYRLTV